MLFYHRPDPMVVLEINPIVGFVANYLCLVLGYLGKFSPTRLWLALKKFAKKKIIVIFKSL